LIYKLFILKKLLFIGASGHAKVVLDVFERQRNHEILGFLDSRLEKGSSFMGYQVLGNESVLLEKQWQNIETEFFVAIGDNWTRHLVVEKIRTMIPEAVFATGIDPNAMVGSSVIIGSGTVIMPGVVVNACSKIGDFSILNTRSSLDHDAIMNDFSSLAPGVVTGGNVHIGKFSAIGLGAHIIHGIRIGEQVVVGAGSLVNKNLDSGKVYYGIPAKEIRTRVAGDKYL
jgi:sugar O-acyltransferase (sialic acid O-acetyltransferase NeuD family)